MARPKIRARIFAGLAVALAGGVAARVPATASAQSFVPARLLALAGGEQVACTSSDRNAAVLVCQAVVGKTGRVLDDPTTHCFGDLDDSRAPALSLRRNVLRSRFSPASIDGEAIEVYVSFRVVQQASNDRCYV